MGTQLFVCLFFFKFFCFPLFFLGISIGYVMSDLEWFFLVIPYWIVVIEINREN